jgi:two-component system cell cycle sensor histidine kinase/response regulator CckA
MGTSMNKPKGGGRLDAFFVAAPAGLAILDPELRFVQLNETMAEMSGLPVQAHLGRRVREVLPALAPVVEPILERILATGEPALNIEVSGDTAAQPGVTRYWKASYFPLPGRGPGPAGIGAIVVEDTARHRAEAARRRSGAEYAAIVENATYGIYRSSVDGRFLKVNPALVQMLGYDSTADVLALDLERDVYVHPEQRPKLIQQFGGAEQIQGVEVEWKRRDGHHIVVRLSGRPARSKEGRLWGFEMVAEDVTEQRTLEDSLRQAQKMKTIGELTSGIAHDFNNLLTVILADAQLVDESLPPDCADLRHDLADLQGAARRGAELVHKLLGFSRRERLNPQLLDLGVWVKEAVATVRRLLPSNIVIECEASPGPLGVLADAGALQQMLMNVANNARDAMPEGGTLHFQVRGTRLDEADRPLHAWVQPGPYVCIAVSDTGVGMDEQTMARIFEPFFTTKPAGVGTGLGMSMVYGLIKQHRGFVHLYSHPGQGTTVKLYLPSAGELPEPAASPHVECALPCGTETVLVIEDDERLRNVAMRLLEKLGYHVLVASDGAEGIATYRQRHSEIQLVISDLMMPGADGFEVLHALRQPGHGPKILFTSGYAAPSLREAVGSDVRASFLSKPWTASELLHEVRALLDRAVDGK